MFAIREQVTSVADPDGLPTGFHISLWFPHGRERDMVPEPSGITALSRKLTDRQLELAALYAGGLTSRQVAERAGTSVKTARAHLEEIYARLGIHSRAQLAAILVREGIA
jgi:DNA-binding CsgD family transcriptional regulator